MPFTFSTVEYCDMHFVYGFCNGSARSAVQEYERRFPDRIGVSHMQVWRTLREDDLYPYHDQKVQHLEPGDYAQRMDLCHWVKAHRELLSVILFTDEASFTRDGINNLRNVHTWSHRNPHATCVTHFQRRFSVNVWCGVLGNRLIGPFVFDNNLTGNTYE